MAILMRQDLPGMAADQFDAWFAALVDQLTYYPGFVANASGPTDAGYQVTEVWETQEAHERWLREVIVPTMQRAGIDQQLPPTQYLTLDRLLTR